MNKALLEALKELGRVALLAVIPVVISQLQNNEINWQVIIVAGVIAVLRAIEKFGFESDKAGDGGVKLPF